MGKNNAYRLIPDWEKPRALVLVWPAQIRRKYLLQFYARFASYLLDDIKLICIIKDAGIRREVVASIRGHNQKIRIQCLVIPDVADIWIRDWGPIPAVDSTGKIVAIKAIYKPKYLSKSPSSLEKAKADDKAGRKLAKLLGIPIIDFPLVWDIGNLTHNGRGTAIVTERLFEDNIKTFSEAEIRALLKEMLNITKLIILPIEPGDETGHIDGMVRFLGPKIVAVGSFPSEWKDEKNFMNHVAKTLKRELGPKYTIVRVPHGIPRDEKSEDISSAVGNHINFLRLGNKLLLPIYEIAEDMKALKVINKSNPTCDIIPVDIPSMGKLASKGGVLNCITWNCY